VTDECAIDTQSVPRYVLVPEMKTWASAAKHCQSINGHLVIIRNAEEQKAVKKCVAKYMEGECVT